MNSNTKKIFSHTLTARIDDINYGHHVCHSKFLNLIHQTRILFLNAHNTSEEDFFGSALIMLKLNIDYLNQCFFNDQLEINITSISIDKAVIKISYSIFNHTTNLPAVVAHTTMGFFDKVNGKLRRPTQECIQLIEDISKI